MKEPDQDELAILPQDTEPDPEEVRRVVAAYESDGGWLGLNYRGLMVAAARAWLKLREQHAPSKEAPFFPWPMPFDASEWASRFRATARSLGYCDMDEGWLITWFANAIMCGFDERERRIAEQVARSPEPSLTIEQVIAACGESGVHIRKRYNVNGYEDGYEAVGFTIPYTPGRDLWVCGDTTEAALRALFDQSIAKLKAARDEKTEQLRKLGIE
jgi:hypothetical protein